jgi:uridine kinase
VTGPPAASVAQPAGAVVAALSERSPTLGDGRLLCVDGPSGSGKTTLARAVSRLVTGSRVVHLDALYDGWDGLPRLDAALEPLLRPLARGERGRYRRYDWHAGRYAGWVDVPPAPLLVLEGVGAWSPAFAPLVTTLVWVEAEPEERLARAVSRDGAAMEPRLRAWAAAEERHFALSGARHRADLVVRT